MVTTRWIASISDGSTAIEGNGPYAEIPGEMSPWLKLQRDLAETGLHITALAIRVYGEFETRTHHLGTHSTAKDGTHERWHHFRPIAPTGYDHFRHIDSTWRAGVIETTGRYIEVRAIYPEHIVSLMVDEMDGNESWVVPHQRPVSVRGD